MRVLVRGDREAVRERQVAIVSGGASGHGNTASFVAAGLLSAAVVRQPEEAPEVEALLDAIRLVTGRPGALLVTTSDPLDQENFALALAAARDEGYAVECVEVPEAPLALGGTMFLHKLTGAAAAEGRGLAEILSIAREAVADMGACGVAARAHVSPITGRTRFALSDDEERGRAIRGAWAAVLSAEELATSMVDELVARMELRRGDRVALLVNGLGMFFFQLPLMQRRTMDALEGHGLVVDWAYCGEFISSTRSNGVSICLLRASDERLRYLEANTGSIAWDPTQRKGVREGEKREEYPVTTPQGEALRKVLTAACYALLVEYEQFPEVARAAGAIVENLRYLRVDYADRAFDGLAVAMQELLPGAEGRLYATILLRMASALSIESTWIESLCYGNVCGEVLCRVKRGEGTVLDVLIPFAGVLKKGGSLEEALDHGLRAVKPGSAHAAVLKAIVDALLDKIELGVEMWKTP